MLAYAANIPPAAGRTGSPKALILIIGGHALALAAALTARPEIIQRAIDDPIVFNVPLPEPPPKPATEDPQQEQPVTQPLFIRAERPIVDMEQPSIALNSGPSLEDIGKVIGSGPISEIEPPRHVPMLAGPRLATAEQALKPPYPIDMRRLEKEATLKLRLTIDTRGRVIAVDPIGSADPSFLEAARRHILKVWRYKPATEDGAAVQSTTVISLSFRLEDV